MNPYWEALEALPRSNYPWGPPQVQQYSLAELRAGNFDTVLRRKDLCARYAWAIPDPDSLDFIAKHEDKIVEIGAGTGYWAWQLSLRGVDVIAYDVAPPGAENHWHQEPVEYYHPVRPGNTVAAREHPDRTLFLCWPPYGEPVASAALSFYAGNTVIYIGEWNGCTGDEEFHTTLETEWEKVAEHPVMQWEGMHDAIYVYGRKA